jgi:hypothetical protein
VKWVSRLSKGGFPISLPLTLELAEEIRLNRYPLPLSSTLPPPISRRWLDRFRQRHPELSTVYSRTIIASRIDGMSYELVNHYFKQLNDLFLKHHYPANAIYNMDESGFSLGSTGNNKVIVSQVTRKELRKFKKIPGRQEWITSIECVGASGVTLPPCLIFKAKYTNSSWLPDETPSDWMHATSNSGWTSDTLGLEWLEHCFIPKTRRNDGKRILLLIDGHSSHLTSKFIARCMEASIDLTSLPPHTSHQLQPLDIGIFGPLKRNLTKHLEQRLRNDSRRIQRVEWMEAFIKAR